MWFSMYVEQIFKVIINTGGQREVRFLYTQIDKMSTPVNCDKYIHVYSVTPTATTSKGMQYNTLKNNIGKSNWNSRRCSSSPQEGKEKKTKRKTGNKQSTNKVADKKSQRNFQVSSNV